MSAHQPTSFGRVVDVCVWDALHEWQMQYPQEHDLSDCIALHAEELDVSAALRPGGVLSIHIEVKDRKQHNSIEHFSSWRRVGPRQWQNFDPKANV